MSNRQPTMTPALPSAPGRPREPGFPCKKVHETEEHWRRSLNQVGQSLLKHGMRQAILIPLRGGYEHKPSRKLLPGHQRNVWRKHFAKVGHHCFQIYFITCRNVSH